MDDAFDREAVLLHAFENDARVDGGAFDRGEEFVLRGVRQIPAERHSAEFGIHQHRAIAIVPGESQKTGFARAIIFEGYRERSATVAPRGARSLRKIAGGGKARLDAGRFGYTEPVDDAAHAGDQIGLFADGR